MTRMHVLAEDVISTNHRIDWDNIMVIDCQTFTHPRCTMKSWHIHKEEGALNREKGILPDIYLYTIDEGSCITTEIFGY